MLFLLKKYSTLFISPLSPALFTPLLLGYTPATPAP